MKIIKQSENYNLVVDKSVESGNLCYQIVNVEYGVVETETYLLPQALQYLKDIQRGLHKVIGE